ANSRSPNVSAPPLGFLESRTAVTSCTDATSTHCPAPPPERLDFRHTARDRSTRSTLLLLSVLSQGYARLPRSWFVSCGDRASLRTWVNTFVYRAMSAGRSCHSSPFSFSR